jgi:hypothetical protein
MKTYLQMFTPKTVKVHKDFNLICYETSFCNVRTTSYFIYNILCCTQLQFRTRAIDGRLVRILNRIILNFDFLGM